MADGTAVSSAERADEASPTRGRWTWRLGWVLLAALVLRLAVAAQHDFSVDEGISYYASLLNPGDLLCYLQHSDRHPPLHYLLLGVIARLSSSELALRLPSIAFALVTTVTIFFLSLRLTSNVSASLLAAGGQALLFGFWSLDVVARGYSMCLCGCTMATWCWARLVLDERRPPWTVVVLYLVAINVATYSYFVALVLVFAHAVALVALAPRKVRLWGVLLLTGVLNLPLLQLIHTQMAAGNTEAFSLTWSLRQVLATYPLLLGLVPAVRGSVGGDPASLPWMLAMGTLSLLLAGRGFLVLRSLGRAEARFLACTILAYVLPLLVAACGSQSFNIRDRYLILVLPYLTILLAVDLARLSRPSWRHGLVGLVVAVNLIVLALWSSSSYLKSNDMGAFGERLRALGSSRDALIVYLPNSYICVFNYYYHRDAYRFVRFGDEIRVAEPGGARYSASGGVRQYYFRGMDALERDLSRLQDFAHVWVVMNRLGTGDSNDQEAVLAFLDRGATLLSTQETRHAHSVYSEERMYLFCLEPRGRPPATNPPLP